MKTVPLFIAIVLLSCSSICAQKLIRGKVTSEKEGVPGVIILVKGTNLGTASDANGAFTITINHSIITALDTAKIVLDVSLVGYASKEVVVIGDAFLEIDLEADTTALTEVVVVGYETSRKKDYAIVRTLFASDRNITAETDPYDKMGTGRSSTLNYGTCDVSIPKDHRMANIEKPSVWRFEFNRDPSRHFVLRNVNIKSKSSFISNVRSRVSSSDEKNAFIFIHGYNVSFADAALRTAQLSYDLGFNGAPIFYSWPSQGETKDYPVDETNIEWTQPHLKEFLDYIITNSGAKNIYLIAHSMGNRALVKSLAEILQTTPNARNVIKEIILAAPDIDADVFRQQIAPVIQNVGQPITLYASSKDLALVASQKFHRYPRAGQSGSGLVVMPGIETIDATDVKTDFLGHSYFAESTKNLSDLFYLIRQRQRANKRFALAPKLKDGFSYWTFIK